MSLLTRPLGLRRRTVSVDAASSAVDDFNAVAHTSFDVTNDDGVAALANGDPIPDLDDQTGNGRDASQATSSQRPVKQTDGSMTVARFDGVDDFMQTANFASSIAQPNTTLALAKLTSAVSGNRTILTGNSTSLREALYHRGSSTSWSVFAGTELVSSTANDGNWHVLVAVFNGASSSLYLDGGAAIASGNAGAQALDGVTLGSVFGGGSNWWDGDLNFGGVYDGNLYADDLDLLNRLGSELAGRAGITWTTIT